MEWRWRSICVEASPLPLKGHGWSLSLALIFKMAVLPSFATITLCFHPFFPQLHWSTAAQLRVREGKERERKLRGFL